MKLMVLSDHSWMSGHGGGSATHAAASLRGRPRGRLRGITTPERNSSPPQTPHGSRRSRAPARHSARTGQSWHSAFASSTSLGDSAKYSSGFSLRHGSSASSIVEVSTTLMLICHLLVTLVSKLSVDWFRETQRPRIPWCGFRGLEAADQ